MSFDALVRGGRVALPEEGSPRSLDIAISGGKVAALLEPGAMASAEREWDVAGRLVLPGGVDPHVHVSWPYLDSRTRDDYRTATAAAARGGTTTIIDFAIEGRESPLAAFERRLQQAEGDACIDFSFHVVVSEASSTVLRELADLADAGATSLKLYMTYRRRGLAVDDATLYAVARRASELGLVIGVHAENADLEEVRTSELRAAGNGEARYLPEAKPPFVEAEAVARAGRIAAAAGARLWVLHLSSAEGLRAGLDTRRATGQPAALETCPQYLFLDRRRLAASDGHRFLCSPPLRSSADQLKLWEGVAEGSVDWIGTDHCVFLAAQKDERADAFWECPHGLPGVETRLPLFLHEALRRGLPPNHCARLLSANAARWFGLYPRKGTLLVGSDADLVAWSDSEATELRAADLHMGADWTPYEGLPALTPPYLVLRRGELLVDSDQAAVPEGGGEFIPRPANDPTSARREGLGA